MNLLFALSLMLVLETQLAEGKETIGVDLGIHREELEHLHVYQTLTGVSVEEAVQFLVNLFDSGPAPRILCGKRLLALPR